MRPILVLAGLGLCSGCAPVPDTPIPVSFVELRDHPERYEGQEVVLEAYIDLCWEGGWLSETESNWQRSDGRQDIQVQPSTRIDADSYDGTFGRVYGLVLSNREPWHSILGVTHVLPLWRFRKRFEPTESTGTTEALGAASGTAAFHGDGVFGRPPFASRRLSVLAGPRTCLDELS